MLKLFRHRVEGHRPNNILIIGPQPSITVSPTPINIIRIGPEPVITVRPNPILTISPPKRSAWEEKGWVREPGQDWQQVYRGYFQVTERRSNRRRRFPGRIIATNREVIPYVTDLPERLRSHPKGPCFMLAGNDWFRVHWHHPAQNVDDTILYIEKILDEVIN